MNKAQEMYRTWRSLSRKQHAAIVAILVGAVMVLIPIITYAYFARDISSKESIMNRRDTGVTLLDRHNQPFFYLYQAKSKSTAPVGSMPKHLKDALIATEDQDYYDHPGFSLKAIAGAFYADVMHKELKYGGSTITQQLVKISLLTQNKSFLRKYQEVILAAEIERRYSKDEILEMYLNSVYLGEGAFGVEAAAQTYFGKSSAQLSLAEAAQLVGVLPAPSAYSPVSGRADLAKKRQLLVLERMVEQKYITPDQQEEAASAELSYRPRGNGDTNKAHHFAMMVQKELVEKYGEEKITRSGYKVTTTLDLGWQTEAEAALKRQLAALRFNQVSNGAVVALDPKTGEIRSLVGSSDWNDKTFGQVNMATALRQPGSAFKPIVYAEAIRSQKITAATVLKDTPRTFENNYRPLNYDRKFRGDVLTRRALANSLNVPAVEVMTKVGVPRALSAAKTMGITTLKDSSDYGPSLVLGTGETRLTELTSAYGVFANGGTKYPITTISSVTNKQNKTIFRHKPKPKLVLNPAVAFIVSSMLSDNSARAEMFSNRLNVNRPAAVKTGTTEDYRDALTVGYTPNLVVGVWMGNNDNTPMDSVAGSLGPAPIWRNLIERYSSGTPAASFQPPDNVVALGVCRSNGLKADRSGGATYTEYFVRSTEPTKSCNVPAPRPEPKENKNDEKKNETIRPNNEEEEEEQEEEQNPIEPTPTPTPPTPPAPQPVPEP